MNALKPRAGDRFADPRFTGALIVPTSTSPLLGVDGNGDGNGDAAHHGGENHPEHWGRRHRARLD